MSGWRNWDWWKIGFFAALVAFEFAREFAVIADSEPPNLATIKAITQSGDSVMVEGKWVRNDSGERLAPLLVNIECNRAEGTCTEATTRVLPPDYVNSPAFDTHPAKFGPDSIEYQNNGVCLNYTTRIDLRAEEAYQVRTRTKDNSTLCRNYGPHLNARLANGWDDIKPPLEGHFVPLLSLTKAVFDVLN
jgi:hypothetical protein